ncbi:MAG: hypothetical protein WCJ35_02355 [Planctomycetota bacterium]
MCFRDLQDELRRYGIDVTQSQIRWAITSGKIVRPPLDGSLRFVFGPEHVEQLRQIFAVKTEAGKC